MRNRNSPKLRDNMVTLIPLFADKRNPSMLSNCQAQWNAQFGMRSIIYDALWSIYIEERTVHFKCVISHKIKFLSDAVRSTQKSSLSSLSYLSSLTYPSYPIGVARPSLDQTSVEPIL